MTSDGQLASELLKIAEVAAQAAVDLLMNSRPDELQIETKSSATDYVTQMDQASEQLIRELVVAQRPHDHIIGEEDGSPNGDGTSGIVWWIDPIDGTTNYVYDLPGWNVSIGVGTEEATLAGVVADPTHGRRFVAATGSGSFCIGDDGRSKRLRLGSPPPISSALVATGFHYIPARRARGASVVAELLPQIRDIRRAGAAALDLCSVAAGRVDAYYEAGLGIWDLAAGGLIAKEAGAQVGALEGNELVPNVVLAAHPDLFGPLQELLLSLGANEV